MENRNAFTSCRTTPTANSIRVFLTTEVETWFDQSCHLLERPTSSAQSLPVLGPTPGSISDWWYPKLCDWTLGGGRFAEDICKMESLSLHPYFSHSNFSSLMLPNPVLCHRGAYTPRHRGCCNTATRWRLTSWPCTRHLLWKGTANTKAQQLPENTSLLPVLCEATTQIEVKQMKQNDIKRPRAWSTWSASTREMASKQKSPAEGNFNLKKAGIPARNNASTRHRQSPSKRWFAVGSFTRGLLAHVWKSISMEILPVNPCFSETKIIL